MNDHPKGMVISESCTDPEWSVAVYPDSVFGKKGAGYFMHRTNEIESPLTPGEIKELAGEIVMQELTGLGTFIAWG